MSKFTPELIDTLAKKVLVGLTPDENKLVLDEFEFIETNMNLITDIDGIDKVKPMTHPFDLYESTLRDDEADESEAIEDLLSNCKKTEGREIEVPKVVG